MKTTRLLAGITAIACISAPAMACPEFNLEALPAGTQSYNPNGLSAVPMQVELVLIDGAVDASCATKTIDIVSRTATNVRSLRGGATVIEGSVPPRQSALGSFTNTTIRLSPSAVATLVSRGRILFDYAWLDAGKFALPGRYTNILDIEVDGNPVTSFESEIVIDPAMRLLGDVSDGQGDIDFGVLSSNEEISTRFVYQTNSKLSVSAESANNGALVHEEGIGFGRVPYRLSIDNLNLEPNGAQSLKLQSKIGSKNIGEVALQLGDIGNPVAGTYSDVLTLNFLAE